MDRACKNPAKGRLDGKMLKTVCLFDPETHASIKALAIKDGVSFAAKVRELVEWGLMEVIDSED